MGDYFPYNLKRWENPALALQAIFGRPEVDALENKPDHSQGPHNPREFAQKLYSLESLQPAALRSHGQDQPEPYSLQWFLDIENQRHSKHGKWIPKLLEFAKHAGEKLLGVGHGLGTDWVQYAQNGASVIVCSPAVAQLELVRRNFDLRRLPGRFIQAEPTSLPLEPSSIDVVCISSLHHGIDEPEQVIEEVYRVLKPGGKVLAVTPAYYDVDFWVRTLFFWNRWLQPNRGKNPALGATTEAAISPLQRNPRAQTATAPPGGAECLALDTIAGPGSIDGPGAGPEGVQARQRSSVEYFVRA